MIPVDEYLNSSYCPDMDYVDGVLVERDVPTIAHSLLQVNLIRYFSQFEKALSFLSLPAVRTQIVERARYRVPDFVLCGVPLPTGKVVTSVPLCVIEILSPDHRMPDQLKRFRDYEGLGVAEVVLLDPEQFIAFAFGRVPCYKRNLPISNCRPVLYRSIRALFSGNL
jgi:Uma2 family endonuclease